MWDPEAPEDSVWCTSQSVVGFRLPFFSPVPNADSTAAWSPAPLVFIMSCFFPSAQSRVRKQLDLWSRESVMMSFSGDRSLSPGKMAPRGGGGNVGNELLLLFHVY